MGVYIDIDKPKECWECFNYNCGHWGTHGYDFAETDCPLIEIVRCKDCKHYITPYENIIDADGLCDNMQVLKDKNDYCSLGERRADDSN